MATAGRMAANASEQNGRVPTPGSVIPQKPAIRKTSSTVWSSSDRPLEDSGGSATWAWVEAQNRLTERLAVGLPARPAVTARLEQIRRQSSAGVPFERGGRWFQRRGPAGGQRDFLCVGVSLDRSAVADAESEAGSDLADLARAMSRAQLVWPIAFAGRRTRTPSGIWTARDFPCPARRAAARQ
jgi:hypothetical protein